MSKFVPILFLAALLFPVRQLIAKPVQLRDTEVVTIFGNVSCGKVNGIWNVGVLRKNGNFVSYKERIRRLKRKRRRAASANLSKLKKKLRRLRRKRRTYNKACLIAGVTAEATAISEPTAISYPGTLPTIMIPAIVQPTLSPTPLPTSRPSATFTLTPIIEQDMSPTSVATFTEVATSIPTLPVSSPTINPSPETNPAVTPTPNPTGTATSVPSVTEAIEPTFDLAFVDPCKNTELPNYAPIQDNTQLDFARHPRNTTLAAFSNIAVGSVVFYIDGERQRIESSSPYSIDGDWGGDYLGSNFPLGVHRLSAEFYSGANASGELLGEKSVSVNFIQSSSLFDPNPHLQHSSSLMLVSEPYNVKVLDSGCYRVGYPSEEGPAMLDFPIEGSPFAVSKLQPQDGIVPPFKFDFGIKGEVVLYDSVGYVPGTNELSTKVRYFRDVSDSTEAWHRMVSDFFDFSDGLPDGPDVIYQVMAERSGVLLYGGIDASFGRYMLLDKKGETIRQVFTYNLFMESDGADGFLVTESENSLCDAPDHTHVFFNGGTGFRLAFNWYLYIQGDKCARNEQAYALTADGIYGVNKFEDDPPQFFYHRDDLEEEVFVPTGIDAKPLSVIVSGNRVIVLYDTQVSLDFSSTAEISPGQFLAFFSLQGEFLSAQQLGPEASWYRLFKGIGGKFLILGKSQAGWLLQQLW